MEEVSASLANLDVSEWLLGPGLRIGIIILVGLVVRLLIGWLIRHCLYLVLRGQEQMQDVASAVIDRPKQQKPAGKSGLSKTAAKRRSQRVATLRSVLNSAASLIIGVVCILMILSEVNINIAPLIASVGIVGVALGFGAQELVKDFITGVFMLIEDQYGVGDFIDIGEAVGTVEKVGLRVTQLRAVDGTLWTVRNGEILRVGNMSQGWSNAVVKIGLEFRQDITQVQNVLTRIADEIRADPVWADMIVAEPFIGGIDNFNGKEITTQMQMNTLPGEQWGVARELRRRIKEAFDAEGIAFSIPIPWNQTQ